MKKILLAVVATFLVTNAFAQNKSYDLQQIYKISAKNNPGFLSSEKTFEAQRKNVPINIGSLLPNITATYAGTKTYQTGKQSWGQSISLNAAQLLFNWSAWSALTQTKAQVKADSIVFAQAQQDLILNTTKVYFSILQSKENLKYAASNVNWNKQLLIQAEQKFKAGIATNADVQSIKAQYQNAVSLQISAKNDLLLAFINLNNITGINIESIYSLKSNFIFKAPTPEKLSFWVDKALKNNLSVVKNKYMKEAAKAGLGINWGYFLPSATMHASITKTYSNNANNKSANVGINAEWNIFNGGSNYQKLEQSKLLDKASEYNLIKSNIDAKTSVTNSFLSVIADISQIKALKQAKVSAQISVNEMLAGYKAGTQTIVDLLYQQQMLFKAQKNYTDAKFNYINDILLLKQSAGILSDKDIVSINSWLIK